MAKIINPDLAFAAFDPEELVTVVVHFLADLVTRLDRHVDKLEIMTLVKHPPKILFVLRKLLDVIDKTFHGITSRDAEINGSLAGKAWSAEDFSAPAKYDQLLQGDGMEESLDRLPSLGAVIDEQTPDLPGSAAKEILQEESLTANSIPADLWSRTLKNPIVAQINDAIGAHGMWKMRLRTAIRTGMGDIDSRVATRDCECAFGKWIHGPLLDPAIKVGTPYQVIRRLHAEFHRAAGDVLANLEKGEAARAEVAMENEFAPRSEKLVRALTKWKAELTRE